MSATAALASCMRRAAKALPPINSTSFAANFDWLGQYNVVCLGDGSHGTSEFYAARAEISKRLIKEHGFKIVALEADWPDAEAIDHYVRRWPNHPGRTEAQETMFKRFPTWMWRNREFQDFVHWLRDYNAGLPPNERAGVYGLDLYSMGSSMAAVIKYLESVDPEMAKEARQRYSQLSRWAGREHEYGMKMRSGRWKTCEEDVIKMLLELLRKRLEYSAKIHDGEHFHSAEQNATLVVDAEEYYRKMYYSDEITWNLRDSHMFETLKRLLDFRSPNNKAIVWAHNSHLGDARYTDMGISRGEINLGQLCREHLDNVVLVGCGTHDGTVAAAHEWDDDMQFMKVNPSREDSWERVCHDTGLSRFLIDMRKGHCDEDTRRQLATTRLERFIGVIYRPATERWSHYSGAKLALQFDAFLFFDTTHAVGALEKKQPHTPLEEAETYPFGL
ncbi:hypothetical protein HRR83_003846 [Exophiala dermatitidis]|uniref:Erythromycin esterase n=2 Tax=Exophiala dermatitidis TaxID=5970 RepID=H6BPM9_EXODN|nr:uncharacterized protein HMPREF1120_01819 [Exophiala dermatitidis NIH/UT8656]KAJ4518864.1 hypothetical protein HRR75_002539 [Exophiala dermatitidis]EHY53631.1 hypothetical protein HMPREF1120_01819 [Exophiala dermatitidis NIH/UT8656]KAJ4522188.1 hypothetical protein HRR74_002770 [Exophiala dermatitidis]KAJ4529514.1 hypothetical protein HRR73_000539 [Exophiala dermatitidis]KAJ4543826.1 hypothetical protein HRR76_001888 [Exophiala dermatitidis]